MKCVNQLPNKQGRFILAVTDLPPLLQITNYLAKCVQTQKSKFLRFAPRGAIFVTDFEITESNEETGMRYLKPANIIEGEIVGEMANIDLSKLNAR